MLWCIDCRKNYFGRESLGQIYLWMSFVPLSLHFIGMRQCQHRRLRERSTDDLEADRQAGSCETAGNGDRRQAQHIKGGSIAEC